MSLLKDVNILSEVKMNDTELLKPNSTTGEERITILLRRIQKGEPLELEKGGELVVDKNKSKDFIAVLKAGLHDEDAVRAALKDGSTYKDILFDKSGQGYKITELKKAAYFGGGSGAKMATAESTAHQESAQAAVIGLALKLRRQLKVEDLTQDKIEGAKSRYDVDASIEQMMAFAQDKQWAKSLVNTANELRVKYKLAGMTIHRGSAWVRKLEKIFNRVNRDESGRIFAGKDKWNPADIWLVKGKVDIPSEDIGNLLELNAWLEKMFEDGKVIGVSLKKTPKDTKSKVFNLGNDVDDLLDITIKDLLVAKSNELFKSKEGHIIYESTAASPLVGVIEERDNSFVIRSFSTTANVNGELAGKYAAGGKIGYGQLNRVLKSLGLEQVTHRNELLKKLDKKKKKDKVAYYKPLINDIIDMSATINSSVAAEAKKNIKNIANDIDFNRLASKYQAVQALAAVKKASKKKKEDFIQKVIQYASSRSEMSSVYIKVW